MPYLRNPGGRIIAVSDEDYADLKDNPLFQIPTQEEADQWQSARTQEIINATATPKAVPNELQVYLATVSAGGKDGYGIASHFLQKELTNLGVNISTANTGQKIAMLFHNPYSITRLEAPYRIIYTMFESTKIPDDWFEYLMAADKVLVPSKYCQDVFAKAGVVTEVVPLGFDDETFKFKKRVNKRKARKDFVFLHYNAFNLRKGFLEVFKAFVKAFPPGDHEPVKMIFKTTLPESRLPITKEEYPNIDIQLGKVSDKELAKLCHDSDCFVFPSRGEGFGMTPLEAMATGLPTIVPNAHGISEYFNSDYMYEVKVAEECPAIYSKYKGIDVGKMVICDIDDLAKQMRYIYDHQDEALDRGKAASEYVQGYTFKKTAHKLKTIFEQVNKLDLDSRASKSKLRLEVVR